MSSEFKDFLQHLSRNERYPVNSIMIEDSLQIPIKTEGN